MTSLKVGFAKRDVTPGVGVNLAGNGPFASTRVHDRLYVRAMAVRHGSEWVAMVSCDLLGLDADMSVRVRTALRERGFDRPEHVLISCTHTHNGPTSCFAKTEWLEDRDEKYLDRVCHALVDAITEADRCLRPALMKIARGLAFENFNRRLITPDGRSHFYKPATMREHPEYESLVGGIADSELDAIQFLSPDGRPMLTLVTYAAHPLTVGMHEHVITADYCGPLVERLEQRYAAPAIFFQGAAGDLHGKGLFSGFARQEEMAKNLAVEAIRVLDDPGVKPFVPDGLRVRRACLPMTIDRVRRDADRWNAAIFHEDFEVEVQAVALGPVVFCSSPGELCCEPGLRIRWNSPFPQTWILYLCNGYVGYLAHQRAHVEGGYESETSCLPRDACETIVKTAERFCLELSE